MAKIDLMFAALVKQTFAYKALSMLSKLSHSKKKHIL
jgi:hypothetical protein